MSYTLEVEERELRPIRKYVLKTDTARDWERHNWKGDEFTVVKNDCEDLQVRFVESASDEDIFDIPRVLFGSSQVKIELGKGPDGRRYKFNAVYLKHSAVSSGEIVIIIGGAASIYTLSSGGFVQLRGYKYDDYYELDYTDEETSYRIGTAARAADATQKLFKAHQIFLEPTTDCYVRFENSNRVQHRLSANVRYEFLRECEWIYVRRVTTNGTLKIETFGWGD